MAREILRSIERSVATGVLAAGLIALTSEAPRSTEESHSATPEALGMPVALIPGQESVVSPRKGRAQLPRIPTRDHFSSTPAIQRFARTKVRFS